MFGYFRFRLTLVILVYWFSKFELGFGLLQALIRSPGQWIFPVVLPDMVQLFLLSLKKNVNKQVSNSKQLVRWILID